MQLYPKSVFIFCLFVSCSFQSLYANVTTTIDFDSLAPGDVVNSLEGVTFTSNIVGLDLVVSDVFDTSSGDHYLGVDDAFNLDVFFPGDVIELSFAIPVTELSVNFISSPFTPGGVFGIDTPVGNSVSSAFPSSFLPDGGEVFPVTFSSAIPFSTASLTSSVTGDIYSYNIDDITFEPVPEPSTYVMVMIGIGVIAIRKLKKRGCEMSS